MTSRVHNEPSAWTHESRARSLPASGAYSHELSSARFPPAASMQGEGARLSLRPLNPTRSPEETTGCRLPSPSDLIIHLQLRVSLHAERDCHLYRPGHSTPSRHLGNRKGLRMARRDHACAGGSRA